MLNDWRKVTKKEGRKPFSTEVTYEHHTPRYSDPTPCWRATDLASQRELGLRAQRWTGLGRLGPGRFVADRSTLSSAEPQGKREVTLREQNISSTRGGIYDSVQQ